MPIEQEIDWKDPKDEIAPQLRGTWKDYNILITPDTPFLAGRFRVSIFRKSQPGRNHERGGEWLGFTAEGAIRWTARKLEKMHRQDQNDETYMDAERQALRNAVEATAGSNE